MQLTSFHTDTQTHTHHSASLCPLALSGPFYTCGHFNPHLVSLDASALPAVGPCRCAVRGALKAEPGRHRLFTPFHAGEEPYFCISQCCVPLHLSLSSPSSSLHLHLFPSASYSPSLHLSLPLSLFPLLSPPHSLLQRLIPSDPQSVPHCRSHPLHPRNVSCPELVQNSLQRPTAFPLCAGTHLHRKPACPFRRVLSSPLDVAAQFWALISARSRLCLAGQI